MFFFFKFYLFLCLALTKLGGGEKPVKPVSDDKPKEKAAGAGTAAPSAAAAGNKKKEESTFYSFLKRW